ncbi:hypothetical protein GOV14_02850 [Candidatus Pacearchaeota archaeon]|nr:hypothetical protein [Candidatus Pacearchaeota archaeon]
MKKFCLFFIVLFFLVFNLSSVQAQDNVLNVNNVSYSKIGTDLIVDYDFNSESIIGDNALVEVWVTNVSDSEIYRTVDIIDIKKEGIVGRRVEKDILIEPGNYTLFIALGGNLQDFVSYEFVIDKDDKNTKGILLYSLLSLACILVAVLVTLEVKKKYLSGTGKKDKKEKRKNRKLLSKRL